MNLSHDMRVYLGARSMQNALLYDTVLQFISVFAVTPKQAGALIAQWIWETI